MNITSLKAKGVEPLSAEPAILDGWRLVFNIPDFFLIEGGTGNIVPSEGQQVHGILYSCREEHLKVLDDLEAVGVNYKRVKLLVSSYSGRSVSAFAYIGIEERLKDGYQPSRRYLNILLRGAELMQIDPRYVGRLKSIEVKTEPVFRPFRFPEKPAVVFSLEELKRHRHHTALAGAVFDMGKARPEHQYLRDFLQGKDMTLFFLKRMDSSDGRESFDDIASGRMSNEQRRYLNNYLHEFDREYVYAGKMDYQLDLSRPSRIVSKAVEHPRTVPSALSVLESAERTNLFLGHENLGFLSQTHGFMPRFAPKLSLPAGFQPWDDVAKDLPNLHRTLALRARIHELPILDASEESLSDAYLLRAAAVLAMLSHAYFYVETSPPQAVPEALTRPWAQVRKRLGREQEVLSYIDLIVYNWRLLNDGSEDPFRVENMDLLFPTVGNREERFFYLTQTEILAQSAPIIGAAARSQEAVRRNDRNALEQELMIIIRALSTVVQESLPKINPNEASGSYVDPVIWAKTVAPFAVPLKAGVQGPSGTSSPIFNLLDAFFSRLKHDSFLGREIKGLRSSYPPFWRDYIEAVNAVSVPEFVQQSADTNLAALMRECFTLYAGPNGFLGRHRMKVYGYLETAFKVGRSVTIGGFSGLFKDRTWEQVDMELEYSRLERQEVFPSRCHYGRIKSVGQTHHLGPENVKHVVIDVNGCGIHYKPGDRCGILPENSDQLIDYTLAALEANGDEPIQLTDEWLRAVQLRHGYEKATTIDLRSFLRFAKIRPVVPRVAEALHAISQNKALAKAIKTQTTARWELRDLLYLLKAAGNDPKILWNSHFHAQSYIARVLPPEQFRMYSISSGLEAGEIASEIHLTVGRLRYLGEEHSGESAIERLGTASNFLATGHSRGSLVSLIIDHPPRFSLPRDSATPVIMIAGGTGFAPFRSFIAQRMLHKESGPCWILLSLKSREHFYYQEDLIPGLAKGMIQLDVVFSQEEARPVFQPYSESYGSFAYEGCSRGHIQDLLMDPAKSEQLWQMLKKPEDGGQGAYLYICGRTRFAKIIQDALKQAFSRFFEGSEEARLKAAQHGLNQIAAEGRFMQEIFTHARSWNTERQEYDVSDIVDHNNESDGYWLIVDHVVYDLSDFIGLHPGGRKVLLHYCGLDATQGFTKVHHGHSEIEAMRDMYEIGVVRQLDFKGVSRVVALHGSMPSVVGVSALYRKWVGILYLLVEMENALNLDQSLQTQATTRYEPAAEYNLYKLQRAIETHERFMGSYASELAGRPFIELWEMSSGMLSAEQLWMKDAMAIIQESPDAPYPKTLALEQTKQLRQLIDHAYDANVASRLSQVTRKIEDMDRRLLLSIKQNLKRGVKLFEQHQAEVLEQAGDALIAELRKIPGAFENYYRDARNISLLMGWKQKLPQGSVSAWQPELVRVIMTDMFWDLEEHPHEHTVVLRRTPIPVSTLEELVASNDRIISLMEAKFASYGIVVDMREAPQRNDEDFENAMLKLRLVLSTAFARVAVLLESASGVLQVNRIGRNDGADTFATMNEFAAAKFARGEGIEPQPSI